MTIDTMDTDVADTDDVTHEEWMQLNNIIQRIDSNVDAPSTKQEPSPVSVIYMPLPVPVTHVYQATYILPLFIPYGMSPQQSAANMPPISKPICKRKIGKQSKDKLNRKRKVGERGKDKLGPEKKRRAPKSCGLCQRKSAATQHTCKGRGNKIYCDYWKLDVATNSLVSKEKKVANTT